MPPSRLTTSAIILCFGAGPAAAQFDNLGLFAGEVRDVAAANIRGSTELLICTTGHQSLYRCGPRQWEPAVAGAGSIGEIEADLTPGNTGTIWAIGEGRLLVHKHTSPWDESGWAAVNGIARADILCGHPSGMYIGGDGVVYRTSDGGQTLSPLATFTSERIRSIAVYNQAHLCVISEGTLHQCRDDGNGFIITSSPVECGGVPITDLVSVAIDPADPHNAATLNRFFVVSNGKTAGLYRTDDTGRSWTRLSVEIQAGRPHPVCFASCKGKRRVFAGRMYSDNFGSSWTEVPGTTAVTNLGLAAGRATGHALAIDPNDANLVYFSTSMALGMWDMTAAKAIEVHGGEGITNVSVIDLAQVATDSATRGIVWAATSRGLGKTLGYPAIVDSHDWLFPVWPQDETTSLTAVALHPGDLDIVLAGDRSGTIYRTTTGGSFAASWAAVFSTRNSPYNGRYTAPEQASITAIKVADANSTVIYAAVAVTEGRFQGAVYRSLNNGSTWDDDFSGVNLNMPVNDLAILDDMVWAGVGHWQDPQPQAKGLYARLSVAGAANWLKMPTGTDLDSQAVLAVEGVQVGSLRVLYAATDHGVFCGRMDSADGARWSWRTITPNGKHRYAVLAADPDNANRVCVAHDNMIWSTSDGGLNWGLVPSTGAGESDQVLAMLHDDLLIGTASGLFAAAEGVVDPTGRIRTTPASRVPTSRPAAGVAATPQPRPEKNTDLLPFKIPTIFGLGITDTVGLWLPLLAWMAIARHNRCR